MLHAWSIARHSWVSIISLDAKTTPAVAPEMDNLDTIKANGGTGIRFRDPQVIGAGEQGNAYDVSGGRHSEPSN